MKSTGTAGSNTHQTGRKSWGLGVLTVLLFAGVVALSSVAAAAEITTQQSLPVLQPRTLEMKEVTRVPVTIKPRQALQYKHTCPSGYQLPNGLSEAILPSSQPVTCSK